MKRLHGIAGLLLLAGLAHAEGLAPLRYNHPGLVVDLGVGLWAWPIPCDADGDGDFDLIVSCPDKPSNGVWLFENPTGDAHDKWPIFKPARRLSPTVHYVMPSDVASDAGERSLRVLSPGYEYPDFVRTGLQKRVALLAPRDFYRPTGRQPKGPKIRHRQWRYADFDGDGALDLVIGIEDWSNYGWDDAWNAQGEWTNGPLHGYVFVLRNEGTTAEPKYAAPVAIEIAGQRLETFGCPSPNLADFDGDGDLDLLCGEFLDGFTYFANVGSRQKPSYAPGVRLTDADGAPLVMELEMIVPIAFDWDRDGDFDLVVGQEDGRVALLENVTPKVSTTNVQGKVPAVPRFRPPKFFQQEADALKCGALATPVGCDWDGDGDVDIVSGNTAGFIEFFENLSGAGVDPPRWAAPQRLTVDGQPFRVMAGPNGSIQGPAEAKWGYTTLSVADWDRDGGLDVVLNSILGDVVWLKNVGTREKPRLAAPRPIEVEGTQPALAWGWRKPVGKGLLTQWRTTPVVRDFTGDGLPDLAMLDPEGYLSLYERAKTPAGLTLQPARRAFLDDKGQALRLNARAAGGSGRRKLCVADWDGDGKFDVLLNSTNADFLRQTGERDGAWTFVNAGSLASKNIEGHDVSPTVVDFDADGVPDFLGGAEDGRLYYLKNPHANRAEK